MNNEILGGLKLALEKGESMKRAMMTFYNAGYKKEEIEEAAQFLASSQSEQKQASPEKPKEEMTKPKQPKPQMPSQVPSKPPKSKKVSEYIGKTESQVEKKLPEISKQIPESSKPEQKISSYENKEPKRKKAIIILISFLGFLVLLLISIFLFKQQLIDFFNKLLG